MHSLKQFSPRQLAEHRNPIVSPLLKAALDRLAPSRGGKVIDALLRQGRVADAAALADQIITEADHI